MLTKCEQNRLNVAKLTAAYECLQMHSPTDTLKPSKLVLGVSPPKFIVRLRLSKIRCVERCKFSSVSGNTAVSIFKISVFGQSGKLLLVSSAQSFLVPNPPGLTTIFFLLVALGEMHLSTRVFGWSLNRCWVLASTVDLGFWSYWGRGPYFGSFQGFTCFEMGPPLRREESSDYYLSLSLYWGWHTYHSNLSPLGGFGSPYLAPELGGDRKLQPGLDERKSGLPSSRGPSRGWGEEATERFFLGLAVAWRGDKEFLWDSPKTLNLKLRTSEFTERLESLRHATQHVPQSRNRGFMPFFLPVMVAWSTL
jgi:hypothetical protein